MSDGAGAGTRYPIAAFLETKATWASGFSPDGAQVLLSSNLTGTMQLYRVPVRGGEPVAITHFEEPVSGQYIPGTTTLVIGMDTGGNERHQLYLIEEDGSGLRDLVVEPDFLHQVPSVTRDGRLFAYACNRRNGKDFDIFVRSFAGGDERCVFDMGGWCFAAGFSPDGRYLAVTRGTEKPMDNDLYLVDLQSGEVIHISPHDDDAEFGAPAWLSDSESFYFETSAGRDFRSVALYDLETRSWQYVIETAWDADIAIDDASHHLLVTTNEDGATRLALYDAITLEHILDLPAPAVGGTGVSSVGPGRQEGARFSPDGTKIVYTFFSPTAPADAWLFDILTRETRQLSHSPSAIPAGILAPAELHRFNSFDGEPISAFVYRPKDAPPGGPCVVWVHGGPESQHLPMFDGLMQYFVYSGYTVVAPNVRGSTGYGKRFVHLDDVYKRPDSVADLAALHDWLPTIDVDPARAALFGGSYGGFMVLAGLVFQPERWAAGVDIVGISSWLTFLENTSIWRRAMREREYGSLEHDREFLEQLSPITHVDKLRAPLFIIHGTNDPRVPVTEAEQIHGVLSKREVPCELLIYDDEGHGLGKLKNRIDAYPKVVAFLDGVLKAGR